MIVLNLIAQASAMVAPVPAAEPDPILWKSFRAGMTPEQVAEAALALPGVSEAKVKRRREKFREISIKYDGDGVNVGDLLYTLEFEFDQDRLAALSLSTDQCLSVGGSAAKSLATTLREKYGASQQEKVVDEQGAEIRTQFAFNDSVTRVRVWGEDYNPADNYGSYGYYGGSDLVRKLAQLGRQASALERQEAIKKCPGDNGARMRITLNYSSQAAFVKDRVNQKAKTSEQLDKLRDDL